MEHLGNPSRRPRRQRYLPHYVILVVALLSDRIGQVNAQGLTSTNSSSSSSSISVKELLESLDDTDFSFASQASSLLQDHDHDHHHRRHDDGNHSHSDSKPFCEGMYMTMSAYGFRWSLASPSNSNNNATEDATRPPPCLAYYVSSWKLNMSGKFRGAMVFSFLLAFLTEGLSASRFALIQYLHVFDNNNQRRSRQHKLVLTIVYALQQWMGTMIMLVGMMYSIEMLLSVVAGLMAGNFLFVRDLPNNKQQQRQQSMNPTTSSSNNAIGSVPASVPFQNQEQGLFNGDCCSGENSNAAVAVAASNNTSAIPPGGAGVNRRSNNTNDEEQQLLAPAVASDTESSLEMQTRKED